MTRMQLTKLQRNVNRMQLPDWVESATATLSVIIHLQNLLQLTQPFYLDSKARFHFVSFFHVVLED